MAETIVCGRCGTRSWAGALTCYACGQSLTPGGPAPATPGQPPVPYAPVMPAAPAAPQQFAPQQFAPPPAAAQPWYGAPAGPGQPPVPYATVPQGQPGQPGQPMPYAPVPPAFGGPGPYGYGAPPAGYYPASPYVAGGARPTGIAVLTVVEIVIGIVGLFIAYDLFYWSDWRFTYDGGFAGGLDLLLGLAYLATSVALFAVASGLWRMLRWAWVPAFVLSVVLLCFIVLSGIEWGVTGLDIIGVCAHLSVLAYLNTNSVRRLFGKSPLGFL